MRNFFKKMTVFSLMFSCDKYFPFFLIGSTLARLMVYNYLLAYDKKEYTVYRDIIQKNHFDIGQLG